MTLVLWQCVTGGISYLSQHDNLGAHSLNNENTEKLKGTYSYMVRWLHLQVFHLS